MKNENKILNHIENRKSVKKRQKIIDLFTVPDWEIARSKRPLDIGEIMW